MVAQPISLYEEFEQKAGLAALDLLRRSLNRLKCDQHTRMRVQLFDVLSHVRRRVHSEVSCCATQLSAARCSSQAAVQLLHYHVPEAVQLLAFSHMKSIQR
jgi:hypothetical protein